MTKHDGITAPFSLRLSFEERARLENEAGDIPLGTYMRKRLLDGAPVIARRYQSTVKDKQALLQVLGLLGQTRLANNINQLAKAANVGTLPVDEETEAMLQQAARDIADIRQALMKAIGLDRGHS